MQNSTMIAIFVIVAAALSLLGISSVLLQYYGIVIILTQFYVVTN